MRKTPIAEKANDIIDRLAPDMTGIAPNEKKIGKTLAKAARGKELEYISNALGQYAARRAFMKVPENLAGAEAEQWVARKLIDLTPDAAAEVEYRLKFGDDDQRYGAALQVMDRTGFAKKDMGTGGSSPIVILTGASVLQVPWRQVMDAKLVEAAKAVPAPLPEPQPDAKE